jgi:hypothetical protein
MRLCRLMCGKPLAFRTNFFLFPFLAVARLSLTTARVILQSSSDRQSLSAHREAQPLVTTTCRRVKTAVQVPMTDILVVVHSHRLHQPKQVPQLTGCDTLTKKNAGSQRDNSISGNV